MNVIELLHQMFLAAIAAAQPEQLVPRYLPEPPRGRLIVVGAGKASAAMAQAVERHWRGTLEGIVVTPPGYAVPCRQIEIVEATHPVPDIIGMHAARNILQKVADLSADDTVLCLISGGGSSLLPLPLDAVTLEHKQAVNRALLRSGATIAEINCVRRHLSAIKGGRLAAACHPAHVVTLLISDVPGDDPSDIASGPTVGDASTCADALAVIRRYDINLPEPLQRILENGDGESIKPDDPRLAGNVVRLIATPQIALEAAAQRAREVGLTPHILSDAIEGEARDVGKVMAGITRQVLHRSQPFAPPCVILSGGETSVTVRGVGRGGRNVEFLLSLAIELEGAPGVFALAGDTDGADGEADIAGAILTPDTMERARTKGIRALDALHNNDGHGFFGALGDSIVTGPTLTNVNDFRVIAIVGDEAM